jgi:hypothetical protein
MSRAYLTYPLNQRGYVHHWLIAGPQSIPLANLNLANESDVKRAIAAAHYRPASEVTGQPVHLEELLVGDSRLQWQYWRCAEDHLIHLSRFYATPHYLRSWAYVQVVSPLAQRIEALLSTQGPARLWVNGQALHEHLHFDTRLQSFAFSLPLQEGANEIVCRFEQVAIYSCAYRMALQLADLPEGAGGMELRLPTHTKYASRFQALEEMFEHAYLDRDIFTGDDEIAIHWPQRLPVQYPFLLRLQQADGRIYAETLGTARPGTTTSTVAVPTLTSGAYQVAIMPRLAEYSQEKIRHRRVLEIQVVKNAERPVVENSYTERLYEGVQEALRRREGLLPQIAAMKIGVWHLLNREILQNHLAASERENAESARDLLALVGALELYEGQAAFPHDLIPAIEHSLLEFSDRSAPGVEKGFTEEQQILAYTLQLLAGQRLRARTFHSSGRTGSQVRRQAEVEVVNWLYERGRYGFRASFDPAQLDGTIFALSQLTALAESNLVAELASILLDKLLFTLALTSHHGIGMGGLLGPETSIARLMWGMGAFNHHLWGVVGLTDSGYEAPAIFADIALNPPEAEWSRERHRDQDGSWAMDRATYRTPDFMLTSIQDHRPGQPGGRERIWVATLGMKATVFVNHPAHCGPDSAEGPGFWQGERILPRVAQWKDTLISCYALPQDDWLGFTHAYFPLYAFDEYYLQGNWAFARRGEAYLALTASAPLTLLSHGAGAHRELRALGHRVTWLCQMGRSAVNGAFAEFQESVLAADLILNPGSVELTTPGGEHLTFGWDAPLFVNGQPQQITDVHHYDTPYCTADFPAEEMTIQAGEYLLNLDFSQ